MTIFMRVYRDIPVQMDTKTLLFEILTRFQKTDIEMSSVTCLRSLHILEGGNSRITTAEP